MIVADYAGAGKTSFAHRWRGRLIWIQCPIAGACRQMMVRIAIMKKRKLRPTFWKIPNIRIIIF